MDEFTSNSLLFPIHDPHLDGFDFIDDEVNEWDEDMEDMKHDYSE